MSDHPLAVSGLPTKPRNLQPSMFQILSWPGQNQLAQSKYIQNLPNQDRSLKQKCCNTVADQLKTQDNKLCTCAETCGCCKTVTTNSQLFKPSCCQKITPIVEQVYKQNRQSSAKKTYQKQNIDRVIEENLTKKESLKKSRLYPKDIKHQLNSFQQVNLKASRAKSVELIQKPVVKEQKNVAQTKREQLDEQTLKQRKQKIKEFQLFTRVLPNSAFTTYYGKPAFQNYGRGASCQNLKSHNIMPHKGENHPKKPQSHYTALIKGRQVKCKSSMPRKPIDQPIVPANHENTHQNQQIQNIQFPLQKPDLVQNIRFSKVRPTTDKKAGPPIVSKGSNKTTKPIKPKNNLQVNPSTANKQKKSKSFVQPTNDGLKYLNKRQNLIQLLQQKKLKASQLAYKVTQCYPLEWNCSNLCQSTVSNQNWSTVRPAGKQNQQSDHVPDIFQGKKIVNQVQVHVKK